tara:strand:- start:401 stop:628 length:228 start_codon:yes stop_codon:yes gene_type:complete
MRKQLVRLWELRGQLERTEARSYALRKDIEEKEAGVVESIPEAGAMILHDKRCILAKTQGANGILGVSFTEVEKA